ncbi:unnamed protein product [Bursaphelenchus okinawaensis]|uniref:Ig-like domain-containing protein n=1 Tax=Bursaphelenchus okinawaensis TaxID=465554 RepID=A0A811KT90_9BILA|nr:unnamed protein product [Bursaphelenchus okinawaensis]CAG9112888.1 unnamed protein product [Bursaphelenchus okinawaensis]
MTNNEVRLARSDGTSFASHRRKRPVSLITSVAMGVTHLFFLVLLHQVHGYQLTSTNDNYLSLVAGFTARMQCSVYRCNEPRPVISWYKDDLLLFNGTEFIPTSGFEPENIVLQESIVNDRANSDLACVADEYTLLLKNLTLQDSGKYRCELNDYPQQLDFHLNVLESGLKFGFNQNMTFDYSECCLEKGMSPLCRPMCKPRDLHLEFFDPTSCQTADYKNFLACATESGTKDYTPCCRQKNIPSFCFDFCTSDFQMLKRSHRLCLYYLTEIFQCFSQPHSLNPEIPTGLRSIKIVNRLKLCWKAVVLLDEPTGYTVHLKEMTPESASSTNLLVEKQRNPRSTEVVIARHLLGTPQVMYLHLHSSSIQKEGSDVCVHLDGLNPNVRYAVMVQTNTKTGVSEPSAPLFLS